MAYLRAVAAENELLRESGLPKNQIVLGTAGSESGGATDALPLSTLLRIPDAFQVQQVAEDADVIWSEVQPVVTEALQQFVTMRQTEGERLAADVASWLISTVVSLLPMDCMVSATSTFPRETACCTCSLIFPSR